MDEPVSIVLDFLRQHNFEKAEEALRLELHARHYLRNSPDGHVKVDVASHEEDATAHKHWQGKELFPHISSMKPESDNQIRVHSEWEFKSCSNNDCVLEFKKPGTQWRRSSQEILNGNDIDARQNGMNFWNSNCEMHLKIGAPTHSQKPVGISCNARNEPALGQELWQKVHHNVALRCDDPRHIEAAGETQQDVGAFEPNDGFIGDESRLVLQTAVHGLREISPHVCNQNLPISTLDSFSDHNWLEHDAAKLLDSKTSSLQLLSASEGFEQLEEKQVVHDCIDYIKALALEDQKNPPGFLKNVSLPWDIDLQTQCAGGNCLNKRQIDDCYNVNSSCFRKSTSSISNATGIMDSFGLDKVHDNALFELTFNLGSFLDIPVGQEIASPGEKQDHGLFQLCCTENGVQDTPELLSGFATLGDEPSDPGMGYAQEFWDSDMYEDDEDPGYERREIEDEDWFLEHEIISASEKIGTSKEKMIEDIPNQSNEGNEMVPGKEDLRLFSSNVLHAGFSDFCQAKSACDISGTAVHWEQSAANNVPILSQIESLSYDGHLMDAEELKFMRDEPIWQGFSSQIEKHVHSDRHRKTDGDKSVEDHVSEEESYCHGQSQLKKATEHCNVKRDFLDEFHDRIDWVGCPDKHQAHSAESIGNVHRLANNSKFDFMSAAVKQERGYPNLSNVGNAFSHSGSLDLQNIDADRPLTMGCLRNTTANNQHMTVEWLPRSVEAVMFAEEGIMEVSKREGIAMLHKQENEELSATTTFENGAILNPALLLHSQESSHVPFPYEFDEARDETTALCAYECAVNKLAVDDGEVNSVQGEAQLLGSEEDEFEVFNLRIIHRKNRTGFEEEKHFQVVLNSVIAGRYLITEYLGSAAFSKAVQARDLQTGMDVCMKIIKNNKDFFDQSLDEIKLLKYINKNDPADKHHLLRLYDYFYHREHLFIVCELLRANLYEFHKFNKESGGELYFTMSRLQSIARQCLEALDFLHSLGLVHCDLKPENILIKSYSRCEIKVIDLGSSCFQTDHLCSYVQSRSYRAPEVILGLLYNEKIDIWSLGCILAELCSGNVLFQNDSLATLLARVIGIIEPISGNMILEGKESHKYFTKSSMLYERNQDTNKLEYLIPKQSSLRHRLPSGDQGFVDFVGYLLQVNPENRPSASEALKHPWLTHPYDPFWK